MRFFWLPVRFWLWDCWWPVNICSFYQCSIGQCWTIWWIWFWVNSFLKVVLVFCWCFVLIWYFFLSVLFLAVSAIFLSRWVLFLCFLVISLEFLRYLFRWWRWFEVLFVVLLSFLFWVSDWIDIVLAACRCGWLDLFPSPRRWGPVIFWYFRCCINPWGFILLALGLWWCYLFAEVAGLGLLKHIDVILDWLEWAIFRRCFQWGFFGTSTMRVQLNILLLACLIWVAIPARLCTGVHWIIIFWVQQFLFCNWLALDFALLWAC